jgi:glycosyltransferase involved in cell wall biosynthesis
VSKWDYLGRILKFLVRAGWAVTRRHLTGARYDLIHVHNIPDFLVFAALVPRFTGARVILDIHDIVPEFFVSKFKASPGGTFYRMLLLAERLSCALANHVIIANHLWYEKLTNRSVAKRDCTTFINYVDVNFFAPQVRKEARHPFRILFPGSLQWHQGLDIAIRAFQGFLKEFPEAEFHIVGEGGEKGALVNLARELGLNDRVKFMPLVPTSAVPALISEADLGVVPKRADSFGNEAYSTKIMEYMAQGVPVIVSRTKIDTFYFSDNEVRFFDSGDVDGLLRAMVEVARSPELRERMVRNGWRYVYQNSWNRRKHDYLTLVDSLIDRQPIPDLPANRRPTTAEDAEPVSSDEPQAKAAPGGR